MYICRKGNSSQLFYIDDYWVISLLKQLFMNMCLRSVVDTYMLLVVFSISSLAQDDLKTRCFYERNRLENVAVDIAGSINNMPKSVYIVDGKKAFVK